LEEDEQCEPKRGGGVFEEGINECDLQVSGMDGRLASEQAERFVVNHAIAGRSNGGEQGQETGCIHETTEMEIPEAMEGNKETATGNQEHSNHALGGYLVAPPQKKSKHWNKKKRHGPGERIGNRDVARPIGAGDGGIVQGEEESSGDNGDPNGNRHFPKEAEGWNKNRGEKQGSRKAGNQEKASGWMAFFAQQIPPGVHERGQGNQDEGSGGHRSYGTAS